MITWVLILFAAGMALILAEFVMPGMICGIIGGSLVLASGVMGCYAYPEYVMWIVVGELLGVVITVMLGMLVFSKTRAGKVLVLNTSQQADAGWVASDSDTSLIGARGEVLTALRPAGTILVNDKRVDAVSEGVFIDKGARVRVIAVHGSRVVAEQADET